MNIPAASRAEESVPKEKVQRAWPRAYVSLPVLVESFGGKFSAHIRDISPGGAMIETIAPLKRGAALILSCGTIQAKAVVVWETGGRFGLKFYSLVSETEIAQQLVRSNAAQDRRLSRTGAAEEAAKDA